MPSGKTHDAVTFLLAVPIFLVLWQAINFPAAAVITVCFLLGGLIFGPDLDTSSNQYARWSVFRILWFPYKSVFKHRSRWSHGLIFGTLIRVVYFAGILTIAAFLLTYVFAGYTGGKLPDLIAFTRTWRYFGSFIRGCFGAYGIYFAFAGLWLGAASHTLTDIMITYIKTGRAKGLL
ncbi:MAG: metal-binding protein [Acidobacteria bacterium]|nr:metal-binding protein [Acidobacteriota bacterium]